MENATKLTESEIQKIRGLQEKYANITAQFGQLKVEQIILNKQVERLNELERTMIDDYNTIQSDEEKFAEEINKKYGNVDINLETGEITPVPTTV